MKQDIIIGYALPPTISANTKVIQIDPSSIEIGRNRGVDVGIVGDISKIVEQLTEEASKFSWDGKAWTEELKNIRKLQLEEL